MHENSIGVELFGREPGYDSSADSIVRASVRQLRAKLREYYSSEGAGDEWEVQIPKGTYVPQWTLRQTVAGLSQTPEPPRPTEEASVAGDAAARHAGLWRRGWPVAAILCLAIASFLLGSRFGGTNHTAATLAALPSPAGGSLMEHFLASTSGPVQFIPSDSILNVLRAYGSRPINLESYVSKEVFQPLSDQAKANPRFWQAMSSRELINIGDASVVLRAARDFPAHAQRLRLRQARDLSPRDLKSGNFVFLGSVAANPWIEAFNPVLNFQRVVGSDRGPAHWRNKAPRQGEPAVFPSAPDASSRSESRSFAHVALIPNHAQSGKILIIAGNQLGDTEAASAFILAKDSGATLASAMGIENLAAVPYFEMLLETRVAEHAVDIAKVVAWRPVDAEIGKTLARSTASHAETRQDPARRNYALRPQLLSRQ